MEAPVQLLSKLATSLLFVSDLQSSMIVVTCFVKLVHMIACTLRVKRRQCLVEFCYGVFS